MFDCLLTVLVILFGTVPPLYLCALFTEDDFVFKCSFGFCIVANMSVVFEITSLYPIILFVSLCIIIYIIYDFYKNPHPLLLPILNYKKYILYNHNPMYRSFDMKKMLETFEKLENDGLASREYIKRYCKKYNILSAYTSYTRKSELYDAIEKYTDTKEEILNNEYPSSIPQTLAVDYIINRLLENNVIDKKQLYPYLCKYKDLCDIYKNRCDVLEYKHFCLWCTKNPQIAYN